MSRFCVNAVGRIHILQLNTGAKCESETRNKNGMDYLMP